VDCGDAVERSTFWHLAQPRLDDAPLTDDEWARSLAALEAVVPPVDESVYRAWPEFERLRGRCGDAAAAVLQRMVPPPPWHESAKTSRWWGQQQRRRDHILPLAVREARAPGLGSGSTGACE
jgi:hypothetical protein